MQIEGIRLYISIFLFIALGLLEVAFSWRQRVLSRKSRIPGNLGIIIVGIICLKILFPLGLVNVAQSFDIGLLDRYFIIDSSFLRIALCLVILDLAIYFQHRLSHTLSWFWCFHLVHHSDHDLDVTSAYRFHPGEIVLSFLYKSLIIILFGIDAYSIILFEIILNSVAMFNHSNLSIKKSIEKRLRLILVTPQMHLNHHSTNKSQRNMNFGFNLSIWDRIFKTYDGSEPCSKIGLDHIDQTQGQGFVNLLLMPFKHSKDKK